MAIPENQAPWIRGDAPESVIRSIVLDLAARYDQIGWDQPAALWAWSWVESAADIEPAIVADLDQRLAELRDKPGSEGCPGAVGLKLEPVTVLVPHPYEALVGLQLPPEVDGVILVTEAWDYPDHVKASVHPGDTDRLGQPSDYPDRVEIRIIQALSRAGTLIAYIARRDAGGEFLDSAAGMGGRVTDALRRILGLPTPWAGEQLGHLLGRFWLIGCCVLHEEGAPASGADLVRSTDPLKIFASRIVDDPDGPAELREQTQTFLRFLEHESSDDERDAAGILGQVDWERLRQITAEEGLPFVPARFAAWADAPMFAREALNGLASQRDLLEELANRDPDAAAHIQQRLAERGWNEPESFVPVTPAGRPKRNDPCPCGSGKKFKHCHGAPAPVLVAPTDGPPDDVG